MSDMLFVDGPLQVQISRNATVDETKAAWDRVHDLFFKYLNQRVIEDFKDRAPAIKPTPKVIPFPNPWMQANYPDPPDYPPPRTLPSFPGSQTVSASLPLAGRRDD